MQPFVIAAGGTGGHLFPAEALAAELISRGHHIVLMTDARSGALQSAVFAGRDVYVLQGAGLAGRGAVKAGRALVSLTAGTLQARRLLRRLGAAAIIGFGGYPSVAPLLAARTLVRRPRLLLHEQNAVLGRANRFLARFADALALGFAGTARTPGNMPVRVTGNPVRTTIAAVANSAYDPPTDGPLHLLITGGSLGARVFSDVVPHAVAALPAFLRTRLKITQQCRMEDILRVRAAYDEAGLQAKLAPFFTNMPELYAAAHLVIARAGASTCAELATVGRPAILVPLPSAIDNHQAANARALEKARAALVIAQPDFSPVRLAAALATKLADPAGLAAAASAATTCAHPLAAAELANLTEALVSGAEVLR